MLRVCGYHIRRALWRNCLVNSGIRRRKTHTERTMWRVSDHELPTYHHTHNMFAMSMLCLSLPSPNKSQESHCHSRRNIVPDSLSLSSTRLNGGDERPLTFPHLNPFPKTGGRCARLQTQAYQRRHVDVIWQSTLISTSDLLTGSRPM